MHHMSWVCCWLLTGENFECKRVLLLDSVREEEASVAAVVCFSVVEQNVGEIQVTIQTHRYSLILRDRSHTCHTGGAQSGEEVTKPQ